MKGSAGDLCVCWHQRVATKTFLNLKSQLQNNIYIIPFHYNIFLFTFIYTCTNVCISVCWEKNICTKLLADCLWLIFFPIFDYLYFLTFTYFP